MFATIDRVLRNVKKADKYRSASSVFVAYPGSISETYRKLYPKYLEASHLGQVFDVFERAKKERVYACISLPPRAGKTETLLAGIVDRLLFDHYARIGYASYGQKFANKKSSRARSLALKHGVPIDITSRSKQDWRTGHDEGGLWATSVGGPITGEGFELLVLDDLLRSRADAESSAIRDGAHEWIISDALTRLEPEGSVILCGTRWHVDDPIGRQVAAGWEEIVIPALSDTEESYWPERWPTKRLLEIRDEKGGKDGYDWRSLYQQDPRAPGDRVFQNPTFSSMTDVPLGRLRVAIGVDFAYTIKKSSDYSAFVVMGEADGVYYVLHSERAKETEAAFRSRVKAACAKWGAEFVVSYIAATEQPNIDLLVSEGVPAIGRRALVDKKTRALPTAAGWNTGRIRVLNNGQSKALDDFVSEVCGFTGADARDDLVDSLAAVYDAMNTGPAIDWAHFDELRGAAPKAFDLALN